MSNPFTIEFFSTTGDPQGVRIIQKTNWSGVVVVFPRESITEVVKEEHAQRPGVYVLVGDLAEETVYIGEADPISARLKQHLQKDWSWGVFFVDSHRLGKTEVQFLEAELVRIAKETGSAILMNKNAPNKPNMTRPSQAAATVFLEEMLLILPMIGVKAFLPLKEIPLTVDTTPKNKENNKLISQAKWDTIVVPAKKSGFERVFLGENCWYAIRINSREIPKLKYIASYRVAPISAVTYISEIAEIVPYQDSGKYLVKFKSKAVELKTAVKLEAGRLGSAPQGPRYTTRKKILNSSWLHELW